MEDIKRLKDAKDIKSNKTSEVTKSILFTNSTGNVYKKISILKLYLHKWKLRMCYIKYDMDSQFVPGDPVCFDKLSRCD